MLACQAPDGMRQSSMGFWRLVPKSQAAWSEPPQRSCLYAQSVWLAGHGMLFKRFCSTVENLKFKLALDLYKN